MPEGIKARITRVALKTFIDNTLIDSMDDVYALVMERMKEDLDREILSHIKPRED